MLSSKVTIVDLFMNIIVKYMSQAISCLFVSKKKEKEVIQTLPSIYLLAGN